MRFLVALLMVLMPAFTLQAEPGQAEPLPGGNIQLETDQGVISLQGLRGKVVYLDFWASWCAPCRKSFPWMNEMKRKYADKGLVIVAVNVDEKRADAARFLAATPADFTVAYDSGGRLASAFRPKAMPSSYIVAPDGSIAYRHTGFREKRIPDYERSLRSALRLDSGN